MERVRTLFRDSLSRSLRTLPAEDRLVMAWTIACGKALAERGSIVGYDRAGVVRVEIRDRAWLREIEGMREYLKSELAKIAGVKVAELHFIVKR